MSHVACKKSKAIFRQLAAERDPRAVHTVIESHEAWLRQDEIGRALTPAIRARIGCALRPEAVGKRIEINRTKLLPLITRLHIRLANSA